MITQRQEKLLHYVEQQKGELVSYEKMAGLFGFASRQSVQYNLDSLIKKGYLFRDSAGILQTTMKPIEQFLSIPLLGLANCKSELSAEYTEYSGEKITIPARMLELGDGSNMYAVTALGDSMMPEIQDGDCVIIERSPDYVNSTKIYLLYDEDDNECILKRIIFDERKKLVQALISTNAVSYPSRTVAEKRLSIEGIVRAVIKTF